MPEARPLSAISHWRERQAAAMFMTQPLRQCDRLAVADEPDRPACPRSASRRRLIVVPEGKERVNGSTSGGQARRAAHNRRRRSRRTGARRRSLPRCGNERVRQRQRVEIDLGGAAARLRPGAGRRAAGRRTRPSSRWHEARAPGRRRAAAPGGDRRRPAARSPWRSSSNCASPAADSPTLPMSQSRSPGLHRPSGRGRGCRRGRSRSVRARAARRRGGRSCRRRSAAGHSFRRPPRSRSRNSSSHSPSPRMVSDSSAPAGVAPLAARSDRLTATSFQPTLAGGSAGRKWTPSAMLSWVMTRPSEQRRIVEQPARRRMRWRSGAAVR